MIFFLIHWMMARQWWLLLKSILISLESLNRFQFTSQSCETENLDQNAVNSFKSPWIICEFSCLNSCIHSRTHEFYSVTNLIWKQGKDFFESTAMTTLNRNICSFTTHHSNDIFIMQIRLNFNTTVWMIQAF